MAKKKSVKDGKVMVSDVPKDKFLGVKRYQDLETGDIIEVPLVEKQVAENNNFDMILYGVFLGLLDEIGNKKVQVLKYLVSSRIRINNLVPLTIQELADGAGTSYRTALTTIQTLEAVGVIKRRVGKIYIDHTLIMDGRYKKGIMTIYNEVPVSKTIDVTPDPQTSIIKQLKEQGDLEE